MKKKFINHLSLLLILLLSFVSGHLINEGFRLYDRLAHKMETPIDICLEDTSSLETKIFSLEEAVETIPDELFQSVTIGFIDNTPTISANLSLKEVWLGLNTPPPEQVNLFI